MPPFSSEPSLPPPDAQAAAHSQRVAEHIAEAIVAEGDWIPFSRYMELALYAPGLGYYAAGARKFGAEGDFVTSPEISPMFARCFALQAGPVVRSVGGDVLELGPGSGIFAADLLDALKEQGTLPERYLLLEVSPDLKERQRELLAKRHPGDLSRFVWIDRLPAKIRGIVIANEVLDVVPCAMLHRHDNTILERGVVLTEAGFAFDDQPIAQDELARRAASVFPPGDYDYLSEVNLAAEALIRTVASSLEAGLAIFIDYGFPEREYYHAQRSMGTLRCHYRHRFHGDPFFMPGLQDITAHVDFTAMARAAEQGGAEVVGFTTQAYFLISCGLAVLVSAGDPTMTLSRLKGTSAVHRLIGPSEMGELFKVLGFQKNLEGPVLGFQSARHLQL
ncbi:MAG TPA: SAM-dependent methyltransferase [Usitatibacter sp.]|jgi:SAM-dependent MidA family methyltransferase|nr:SAM-dependent methyltransferase [Usitatibacter sp.]